MEPGEITSSGNDCIRQRKPSVHNPFPRVNPQTRSSSLWHTLKHGSSSELMKRSNVMIDDVLKSLRVFNRQRGRRGRGHYNRLTLPADRTRSHDKMSPGPINGQESRGRHQRGRCDSRSSTSAMRRWGEVNMLSEPSRNSQISHHIENVL